MTRSDFGRTPRLRRRGAGAFAAWLFACGSAVGGGNFTTGGEPAVRFGVHEVVLTGDGSVANPFDTEVSVRFTPPSGAGNAKTVRAFFDGGNTWRARVNPDEVGGWSWSSACAADPKLDGASGTFRCGPSKLHGGLRIHPKNPRRWITQDGRPFLNLSDTSYFLLCGRDGNGDPVSDDDARRYARDDAERGVTSLRCFLASRRAGFSESAEQWREWYFPSGDLDRPGLENLGLADRRLRLLLDEFPDLAVQLILFPLEAYARDDRFWTALGPARRGRLLRQLTARFSAYPQILWLVVNDAHFGDKFPNNNAMAREVGGHLLRHDPWGRPRSTGHARRLPFVFGGEDWATYVHIEHAHDLGALEFEKYKASAKPVFLGEDRYEQDHGPKLDPVDMRYWQRQLFWAWLLSGGSANYGGRWWAVHPYGETGTRPTAYHKRGDVVFRKALTGLDSIRPIRDYFEGRGIDLGEFEPDHALAGDADGGRGARAPRLSRRGRVDFLVYHPHAAADEQAARVETARAARLRLDLLDAPGTFAVEWFRCEDGAARPGADVVGGDRVELTAPWTGADVVVRLLRK